MAATDPEALRKLARLARLDLDAEELRRLTPEFERILAAFAGLASHAPQGDQDDDAPTEARLRGDEPLPSLPRAKLLAGAPAVEDGFLAVPKTIGGEP